MASDGTFVGTSGHGSRAGKRPQVIAALLTSRTHADAAASCGIGIRTLQRWLKEESFASAYQAAKRELVDATTGRLRANGIDAAETLREVAAGSLGQNPGARVSAARATLEFLYRGHEDEDLASRLDRLESERNNDGEKF
jgi:hypothetical protein